jgi:hypothetical protein
MYSDVELAIMTRSLSNFFENDPDMTLNWLPLEARMFEKRVGEPIVINEISKRQAIEFLKHLGDYYAQNGALSWFCQLRREWEWLEK